MKSNSVDMDGTHRQHRGGEKCVYVGTVSQDRKSALVTALQEEFKCEVFEHSMYSTDRAPSDYHLFFHIKKFLAGQRLTCDQNRKKSSAGLAERLGDKIIQKKATKAGIMTTKFTLIYMATKWSSSLI
jgi:hypothetical protein